MGNLGWIHNWRDVLAKAWSVRLAAAATVVLALGSLFRSISAPGYENLCAFGSFVCDVLGPALGALAVPARFVDQGLAKPKPPPDDEQLGIGS